MSVGVNNPLPSMCVLYIVSKTETNETKIIFEDDTLGDPVNFSICEY
jgi:hypothetical protein